MNKLSYTALAVATLLAQPVLADPSDYNFPENAHYPSYYYSTGQAPSAPTQYNNAGWQTVNGTYPDANRRAPLTTYNNTNGGYAAAPAAATAAPMRAAPAYRPASNSYNWSSCYGGLYVGGAFGGTTHAHELVSQGGAYAPGTAYNATNGSYEYDMNDQVIGGGTVGCNYEAPMNLGPATGIVLGLEGEGGSFNLKGSGSDPNAAVVENSDTPDASKIGGWDAIGAARLGVAFDRFLVYGKVGAFFANATSAIKDNCTAFPCGNGTINATSDKLLTDLAVGGGLEYAVTPAWSVKGEYLYLDTSDQTQVCGAGGGGAAGSNFCSQHSFGGTHTVKLGLNYHFLNY